MYTMENDKEPNGLPRRFTEILPPTFFLLKTVMWMFGRNQYDSVKRINPSVKNKFKIKKKNCHG